MPIFDAVVSKAFAKTTSDQDKACESQLIHADLLELYDFLRIEVDSLSLWNWWNEVVKGIHFILRLFQHLSCCCDIVVETAWVVGVEVQDLEDGIIIWEWEKRWSTCLANSARSASEYLVIRSVMCSCWFRERIPNASSSSLLINCIVSMVSSLRELNECFK